MLGAFEWKKQTFLDEKYKAPASSIKWSAYPSVQVMTKGRQTAR